MGVGKRRTVPALLLWLATACGQDPTASSQAPAADGGAAADGGNCGAAARLPNGTCCPPGTMATAKGCAAVGPADCGDPAEAHTAACEPRWCLSWQTDAGQPCDERDAGCRAQGHTCSSEERAAGLGCRPGWWPDADGTCQPAGPKLTGGGENLDDVLAPPGVPPLEPLPPLADTRFCAGQDGQPALCDAAATAASACTKGQMPDPDTAGACLPVGAPWACPPGFVASGKADPTSGLPACVADSKDCSSDPFGGVQDGPTARFVDTKAAGGGDGSRAKPYRTVSEAVDAAPSGGTVAVAAGSYDVDLYLSKPLTLRGRCAALVTLKAGVLKPGIRVVGPPGGETIVEGLRVIGGARGFEISSTRTTTLRRLWLSDQGGVGILASGTGIKVGAEQLYIQDTATGIGGPGNGLVAQSGARVEATDVRIHNSGGPALLASHDKSRIRGRRVVIHGVVGGPIAEGAQVKQSAVLQLTSSRITLAAAAGVVANMAGTQATLTGVIIDHTRPAANQALGTGVVATSGSQVTLRGVRLSGNHSSGLGLRELGTRATVRGMIADATLASPSNGELGWGLAIAEGAEADVADVRLHNNTGAGAGVVGAKCRLVARRLLIDETQPMPLTKMSGCGVLVGEGAYAELETARLTRNRARAISVAQPGSRVLVRNALVDDTLAELVLQKSSMGVGVSDGASATLIGVRLTGNRGSGVVVLDPGSGLDVVGSLIDSNLPLPKINRHGFGLFTALGGSANVIGSRVARNHEMGVLLRSSGTMLVAGSVVETSLPDVHRKSYGCGIAAVYKPKQLGVVASILRKNHAVNLMVDDATVQLLDSVVSGAVGAEVETGASKDEANSKIQLGDGVVIAKSPSVTIERSLVLDNVRAGVMLTDCPQVNLVSTGIAGGYFGVVTQGATTTAESTMALWNNTQNHASPEGLYVPAPPSAVDSDVEAAMAPP